MQLRKSVSLASSCKWWPGASNIKLNQSQSSLVLSAHVVALVQGQHASRMLLIAIQRHLVAKAQHSVCDAI